MVSEKKAVEYAIYLYTFRSVNGPVIMSFSILLLGLVALVAKAAAVGVVGTPVGFGTGTTGGGSATPAYPSDIAQLKSWLTDSTARVIVLNKEYVGYLHAKSIQESRLINYQIQFHW